MPRRPAPPEELTVRQIRAELRRVIQEMHLLGSGYDLSNGQLRYRIKLLERQLRELHRRIRIPPAG